MQATTTPDAPTVSQRIRTFRHARGLSQMALAHRAGLGLGTTSLAERGLATQRTLKRIARALQVPVEDLVRPEDAPRDGGSP